MIGNMPESKILQEEEPVSASSQLGSTRSYHILVVDDEVLIRRLNNEVLTAAGYRVDLAEDGVVAWNMLQLNPYDLLITDNVMPKMTGVELLLKLHASHRSLPTLLVSGTLPSQNCWNWWRPFYGRRFPGANRRNR